MGEFEYGGSVLCILDDKYKNNKEINAFWKFLR